MAQTNNDTIFQINLKKSELDYILDLLNDEAINSQEWGIVSDPKTPPFKMGYLDTSDTIKIRTLIKNIQNQINDNDCR